MPAWTDDVSLSDETLLWRRVHPSMFSLDAGGTRRVTSFAFKSPDDQLSMDVSTETTLEKMLAAGFPGQVVIGIKVGLLRELGYIVARDPEPDNPAHVLVIPKPGKSKNQKHRDRQVMALNAVLQ